MPSVRPVSLMLDRVSAMASSITCDRFSVRIWTSRFFTKSRIRCTISRVRFVWSAMRSSAASDPLSISRRDEPTTGIDVVADRSEWLIDLVDERGHHLAEFIQALNMGEFRLQFLNALVTRVTASQISQVSLMRRRSCRSHL